MERTRQRARTAGAHPTTLRGLAAGALGILLALAVGPLAAAASPSRTGTRHDPGAAHGSSTPRALMSVVRQPAAPRPDLTQAGAVHPTPGGARPHLGTPAVTFTVTTTTDSPLASLTSTHCVDAAGGHCSLRAAVQAANNLGKPVEVKLGPHTYSLTDTLYATLFITNGGGTSIGGVSAAVTKIAVPSGDLYQAVVVAEGATGGAAVGSLSDLTVTGGTNSTGTGGGLYVANYNASLVLDHVVVTHSTAQYGGGVGCYESSLWATDSSFSGNVAFEGGGLFEESCAVHLQDVTVNGDLATNPTGSAYGGGVYAYFGVLHLVRCTISDDTAGSSGATGYGGGVYDEYAGTWATDTTVNHDTAKDGGEGAGVATYQGSWVATGGSMDFDHAEGITAVGGGLFMETALVVLHHVDVSHDTTGSTSSSGGGGGIYAYSNATPVTLIMDAGSTVEGDATAGIVAYSYYGGVRIDVSHSTIKNNGDSLWGAGGVFAYAYQYGGVSVSLADDLIAGNHDPVSEAAGGVFGYAYQDASADVTLTRCVVQGNVASGASATGGVAGQDYLNSALNVVVDSSKVLGNHAPDGGYGGAIGVWQYQVGSHASLQVDHDLISGNVAGDASVGGYGGGIMTYYYVLLTVSGSTIDDNVAQGSSGNPGYGGGVYDNGYLPMTITGTTIDGNRALGDGYGGGLYSNPESGGAYLIGSTVDGNAAAWGGGIAAEAYQLDVQGSTIANNVAHWGGGIYDYYDVVYLTNSTLTGNRAAQGGAIYLDRVSATLYLTTVSGNAAPLGGGIYITSVGSGSIRDSILSGNHVSAHAAAESECHLAARYSYLASAGDNVLARPSCVDRLTKGDVVSAAPRLGLLAHNGGATETMALLAGSPAMNAVHLSCTPTDQRGVPRPAGVCDAGAFQHHGAVVH